MISRRKNNNLIDRPFGPNWSELRVLSIEKVVKGDAAFVCGEVLGRHFPPRTDFFRLVEILAYLRCQYNIYKNIVITTGSSVVFPSRR